MPRPSSKRTTTRATSKPNDRWNFDRRDANRAGFFMSACTRRASPTMRAIRGIVVTTTPLHIKRYLITGLLAFIPVWITWVVFKFVFTLLAGVGAPLVSGIIELIGLGAPHAAQALHRDWVISIIAFVITIVALYLLGWLSTRVLLRRLLGTIDKLLERIPLVHTIYGGVKKLMTLMRNKPGGTQR